MKERPILFNGAMVRAILEGRKTQTRRIVKTRIPPDAPRSIGAHSLDADDGGGFGFFDDNGDVHRAPYQPGDLLWVRESCDLLKYCDSDDIHYPTHNGVVSQSITRWIPADLVDDELIKQYPMVIYKGQQKPDLPNDLKYHPTPSIHMPRWASRITLKVTSVRVERLNEITEDDAKAEGASWTDYGKNRYGQQQRGWSHRGAKHSDQCLLTAKTSFWNLWESVYGEGSWSANPWVWVIEFEQLESSR